jgi:uncharacterized membrane protein YqaE (UPF0057 family)
MLVKSIHIKPTTAMVTRLTLLLLTLFAFSTAPLTAAIVVPTGEEAATTTPITTEAEALAAVEAYGERISEMSGKERRELKREKRRAIKKALKEHQGSSISTVLLVILTVIFPPLGMAIYDGGITTKFWISLLLTLLFYLPGLIYVLLQILG